MTTVLPSTFRKGLSLLSPREKVRGKFLLFLIFSMSLVEAASVVSILPFLTVVSDPSVIHSNMILRAIHEFLGEPTIDKFALYMGIVVLCITIFAALLRTVTHYAINRYTQMRLRSIGLLLIETYLRLPYSFFLKRHSGEMSSKVLSEAVDIVDTFYKPLLTMFGALVTLLAIIIVLVVVDPLTAGVASIIFGGAFGIVYISTYGYLKRAGHQRAAANKRRFATTANIFSGIKTIKVSGAESTFKKLFDTDSLIVARRRAETQTIAQLPRFAIEAIAFGGIVTLCLILLTRGGGIGGDGMVAAVPVLGLYGIAGYRLIPAFQQIFASAASLRVAGAAIDSVYSEVAERNSLPKISEWREAPLQFREAVTFDQVSFNYPSSERASIKDLSLTIPMGARIGVVGSTGAGKTTFVDLLLGVLRPTEGSIRVDSIAIDDETIGAWQRNVGYVPQEIFLVDASIKQNIAFDFSGAPINEERVIKCLQTARLYNFIISELSDGLDTRVGERGVRLSGGQRQRLGIARALYHDPAMLILDEATSALDNLTEMEVTEAVADLGTTKTVVMVAHRLSSLRDCDTILLFKHGRLAAVGSYDTLFRESDEFRSIAELR